MFMPGDRVVRADGKAGTIVKIVRQAITVRFDDGSVQTLDRYEVDPNRSNA